MPGDLPQLFVALGIFSGAVVSGFTGFAFFAVAGAVLLPIAPLHYDLADHGAELAAA